MNDYRVDVARDLITPCGMCSLLYLGENFKAARQIFEAAPIGFDSWNRPNVAYGVILSVWDGQKYTVKCTKGV